MAPHIYSPVKFIPLSPRTMVRLKRPRDDSTSVVRPIVHGSGQIGRGWALTVRTPASPWEEEFVAVEIW